MIQRNCKNCGAPIQHSYNHKCPYCATLIDFNEPKEKTVECKPEQLINLDLIDIDLNPISLDFIFKFTGYKLEDSIIYEVNGNTFISKYEEYINPPKCYFVIAISELAIRKYGISIIEHQSYNSGIRYEEIYKLILQIKDKRYKLRGLI